jgi:hypothetical protein
MATPTFLRGLTLMQRTFVIAAFATLIQVHLAWAADIYVDRNATNPVVPYSSWATAATSLHSAVASAAGGDSIWVAPATYAITSQVVLAVDVSLIGANGVIVDGLNTTRCFMVEATNALIQGFTIKNGYAGSGAGVYLVDASAVRASSIVSNTAVWSGGGIAIQNGGRVFNCSIMFNCTTGFGGAGLAMQDNGLVSNCVLACNRAAGSADGGGARVVLGGTLRDCIMTGNTARAGGGMMLMGQSAAVNCLLAGNIAGQGGGVACADQARVQNCTVAGNTAQVGGGLDAYYGGVVANSIVYHNTAGTGSNVHEQGSASAPLFLYSCVAPAPSGIGMLSSDPAFVGVSSGDYRLATGSICIDSGTADSAPGADITGQARPLDGDGDSAALYDMGAYEREAP